MIPRTSMRSMVIGNIKIFNSHKKYKDIYKIYFIAI